MNPKTVLVSFKFKFKFNNNNSHSSTSLPKKLTSASAASPLILATLIQ